ILPQPIRAEVESAVEKVLASNSSEFFDEAMIQSMLCATGIKAAVKPEVFKKIFDAWRHHQVLKITYVKPNDEPSERLFEPHIIAFYHGIWYIKGYDFGRKDAKSLAVQRISTAVFAGRSFITDKKLLENTRQNGLFEYPKIEGIRLKCDASISFYLREHQKAKQFAIEPQDDGSLIVALRPSIEHEVIKWILGEAGHIEVLQPIELRRKVADAAKRILEKNS
ncbi:MAG: WYL domain-containing protein, partial [Victivallales bacterium]|nr:WYL domain-containing protein [Victivallales bacterium]